MFLGNLYDRVALGTPAGLFQGGVAPQDRRALICGHGAFVASTLASFEDNHWRISRGAGTGSAARYFSGRDTVHLPRVNGAAPTAQGWLSRSLNHSRTLSLFFCAPIFYRAKYFAYLFKNKFSTDLYENAPENGRARKNPCDPNSDGVGRPTTKFACSEWADKC